MCGHHGASFYPAQKPGKSSDGKNEWVPRDRVTQRHVPAGDARQTQGEVSLETGSLENRPH